MAEQPDHGTANQPNEEEHHFTSSSPTLSIMTTATTTPDLSPFSSPESVAANLVTLTENVATATSTTTTTKTTDKRAILKAHRDARKADASPVIVGRDGQTSSDKSLPLRNKSEKSLPNKTNRDTATTTTTTSGKSLPVGDDFKKKISTTQSFLSYFSISSTPTSSSPNTSDKSLPLTGIVEADSSQQQPQQHQQEEVMEMDLLTHRDRTPHMIIVERTIQDKSKRTKLLDELLRSGTPIRLHDDHELASCIKFTGAMLDSQHGLGARKAHKLGMAFFEPSSELSLLGLLSPHTKAQVRHSSKLGLKALVGVLKNTYVEVLVEMAKDGAVVKICSGLMA